MIIYPVEGRSDSVVKKDPVNKTSTRKRKKLASNQYDTNTTMTMVRQTR